MEAPLCARPSAGCSMSPVYSHYNSGPGEVAVPILITRKLQLEEETFSIYSF